jgi:hypothetical protein
MGWWFIAAQPHNRHDPQLFILNSKTADMYCSKIFTVKAGAGAILMLAAAMAFTGCKKLVEIDRPRETVATEKVFNNNQNAYSALAGMYSMMMTGTNGSPNFSNGGLSIYAGMMADEVESLAGLTNPDDYQFYANQLRNDNLIAQPFFWDAAYKVIYAANSILEGVAASISPLLTDSARIQLMAESKFVRAYCHFMLLNLHGDIPLITTTDIRKTALMPRTPAAAVYQQIEADLKDAFTNLPDDYQFAGMERNRPNKWAAAALLARVYLYQQKWAEAEAQATAVIGAGLYDILPLTNVFKPNSQEAIFQLEHTPGDTHDLTVEAAKMSPFYRWSELPPEYQAMFLDPSFFPLVAPQMLPGYILTPELLAAFEPDDNRRTKWIDGFVAPDIEGYHGKQYFYPVKYAGLDISTPNAKVPDQAHMVLRLAEQYLIRAEARARQGTDLAGAAGDIDKIRLRAGLGNTSATTKEQLLEAILHERQTELFTEDGQRWFDLRRFGKANAVLGAISAKQPWNPDHLLLPIPASEIQRNPLLKPNPGY